MGKKTSSLDNVRLVIEDKPSELRRIAEVKMKVLKLCATRTESLTRRLLMMPAAVTKINQEDSEVDVEDSLEEVIEVAKVKDSVEEEVIETAKDSVEEEVIETAKDSVEEVVMVKDSLEEEVIEVVKAKDSIEEAAIEAVKDS